MTEPKNPTIAKDGYSKSKPLTEGYLRKGGSNSAESQIQTRPSAPAAMKPATSQEGSIGAAGPGAPSQAAGKSIQSGGTKQGGG
jgi:hypothetical protein